MCNISYIKLKLQYNNIKYKKILRAEKHIKKRLTSEAKNFKTHHSLTAQVNINQLNAVLKDLQTQKAHMQTKITSYKELIKIMTMYNKLEKNK